MRIGDYEIEAELGEGGMAKVYRAKHAFLETMHAIKVLAPEYRVNAEARRRFLDEAKIQAKHLDHPNIVKVTNIVATDDHAALVMELVDGGSLEGKLGDLMDRPDEVTRIMLGVLDAVGHAHAAGIIHRDLKPANVLLAHERGTLVPKVTDFGIAKVIDAGSKGPASKKSTHMASRMGTLGYMSPEQIRRAKDVTARSDIFSLGAMLYELVTGELPFAGDSDFDVMENIVNGRYVPARTRNPSCDPRIAAAIEKALAVDPMQRYLSCAEMAAALRGDAAVALAQPGPTASTPTTPITLAAAPVPAPARESRAKLMLVATLCLVGAAALGGAALVIAKRRATATATPPADAAAVAPEPAAGSATDPWAAGSGSSTWQVDPRAFPAGRESPPAGARSTATGIRYVLAGGRGAPPKIGEHFTANVRMWSLTDKHLIEDTIGKEPQEVGLRASDPLVEVIQQMSPGTIAQLWMPAEGSHPPSYAIVDLLSVFPAPTPAVCMGEFHAGDDLSLSVNGATLGVCGHYEFRTTGFKGPMTCGGDLSCSGGIAKFACTYSTMPNMRLAGEMTWICKGAELHAAITIGATKKDWILQPR